ncbi:hypothetical protein NDU88_004072 [Pleurodeles waltl]|uniref:Uncharacterized protein n=1 Tax=Pleurodeles waltl TaxID=8319 RepID=A0AAV7MSF8_PLEWA|nr:hypothetical protein NDU88_004072 [Pleurodeles waltl]
MRRRGAGEIVRRGRVARAAPLRGPAAWSNKPRQKWRSSCGAFGREPRRASGRSPGPGGDAHVIEGQLPLHCPKSNSFSSAEWGQQHHWIGGGVDWPGGTGVLTLPPPPNPPPPSHPLPFVPAIRPPSLPVVTFIRGSGAWGGPAGVTQTGQNPILLAVAGHIGGGNMLLSQDIYTHLPTTCTVVDRLDQGETQADSAVPRRGITYRGVDTHQQ